MTASSACATSCVSSKTPAYAVSHLRWCSGTPSIHSHVKTLTVPPARLPVPNSLGNLPALEQRQLPWEKWCLSLSLEWCSVSLEWCCPVLDWCRPSWQQCLLLSGEQSPLRLEWCLCHPSDPAVWWHQLCGHRPPPAGSKIGDRRRRHTTWPEGLAQVLSHDFAWLCSSLMLSTAAMHRYPQFGPHHHQRQPNIPTHLIYLWSQILFWTEALRLWVLHSSAAHRVGEKYAANSSGDPCCICEWCSLWGYFVFGIFNEGGNEGNHDDEMGYGYGRVGEKYADASSNDPCCIYEWCSLRGCSVFGIVDEGSNGCNHYDKICYGRVLCSTAACCVGEKYAEASSGDPCCMCGDDNLCEGLLFLVSLTRGLKESMMMKLDMVVAMGCFAASSASSQWSVHHLVLTSP